MRKRWVVASLTTAISLAIVVVVVALSKPRPTYHDLIPKLSLGQSEKKVKSLVAELGLSSRVEGSGMYVGGITPLNIFRKEYELVLTFDARGRLNLVYEDIVYRYDDIGSRDVEVGPFTQ